MAFSSIITHRIYRDFPTENAKIHSRAEAFDPSGKLDELIYELKTGFIRKGTKHYGRFSSETVEFPFASWLQEYRQERLGFASFTLKAMNHLKDEIEKIESVIDAYIFFALEKIEAGEFLHVFAVEHTGGIYLDTELTLSDSLYLDSSGFSLAAKINLSEWEAGDSLTYLALLGSRGEKDLAEAFGKFIGFSDKHDIKSDTVDFLQAVESFSQTLDEPTARVTRNKVVDYCLEQKKAGKPVVINELSNKLSQEIKSYEPEYFSRHIETQQTEAKLEFIPDAGQLRNYIRISGRNDNLSMSFASECLGNEIVYDPNSDSLTIKNIPPALKARLLKHLKEK
ncbi:MAG TPA: nucleoid-associated protein [Cellvibrio sp.]|nr:nucleoid-associated protein [Cellvibrio sp.]